MAKSPVWVTAEEAEVLLGFVGELLGEATIETSPHILELFSNIYHQLEEIH